MTARGDRRLEAAVALGIITAQQADEIRAIAPEPDATGGATASAPRPFDAASLAYVLGAITVVIAMVWLLAERWEWLGAKGVLAVSLLYAALFVLVGHRLRRQGYPTAAGLAVLLAVCMAPVAAMAWNDVIGWYTSTTGIGCRFPDFFFWACRGEELFVELVTAAAALVALRHTRFPLLVLPLAGLAVRLLFHLADAIGRNATGDATGGWVWVIGASVMAAAAYAIDRRQAPHEDFGLWIHIVAVVCAIAATVQLLSEFREFRHLLIPGAFVAFAAALTMRRFAWMLLGMTWFIWYLVWLASDVFKDSPLFPVALAALGLGMIVVTVWVQRNAERLVARFGSVTSDGRPRFPGGIPLLLSPALVAMLLFPQALQRDADRREEQEWQIERFRMLSTRDSLAGAAQRGADSTARPPAPPPAVRETVLVPRP